MCDRIEWKRASMWYPKTPKGWTMMAHEKRGKIVCRYFYAEADRERR